MGLLEDPKNFFGIEPENIGDLNRRATYRRPEPPPSFVSHNPLEADGAKAGGGPVARAKLTGSVDEDLGVHN